MKTINLSLFASGSGTNVENIANYFAKNPQINISCVLCNKPDAYVIERAKKLKLDFLVFNKADFQKNGKVECYLLEKNVNFIILAGFLWLIPEWLIEKYPNKIVIFTLHYYQNMGEKECMATTFIKLYWRIKKKKLE